MDDRTWWVSVEGLSYDPGEGMSTVDDDGNFVAVEFWHYDDLAALAWTWHDERYWVRSDDGRPRLATADEIAALTTPRAWRTGGIVSFNQP